MYADSIDGKAIYFTDFVSYLIKKITDHKRVYPLWDKKDLDRDITNTALDCREKYIIIMDFHYGTIN